MKAPKRVSSGKYVDLSNLAVEDIDLGDINNSLNFLYRFTGHFKDVEPLTVAQHTWLVMDICRHLFPGDKATEFDCLLHDMPEAYYGDIATPLKRLFGDAYKNYTSSVDKVVYEKLWKLEEPFSDDIKEKRKVCDLLSLDIERRTMWSSPRGKDLWPEVPQGLEGFTQEKKRQWFMKAKERQKIDLVKLYEQF